MHPFLSKTQQQYAIWLLHWYNLELCSQLHTTFLRMDGNDGHIWEGLSKYLLYYPGFPSMGLDMRDGWRRYACLFLLSYLDFVRFYIGELHICDPSNWLCFNSMLALVSVEVFCPQLQITKNNTSWCKKNRGKINIIWK